MFLIQTLDENDHVGPCVLSPSLFINIAVAARSNTDNPFLLARTCYHRRLFPCLYHDQHNTITRTRTYKHKVAKRLRLYFKMDRY